MTDKEKANKKRRRIERLKTVLTVLLVGVTLLLAILNAFGLLTVDRIPKSGATFLFLSVGQASCSMIFTEDGVIMIDTGANASEDTVTSALSYYGVKELELLVLTHADEDHAGGLDAVLKHVPVKRVLMNAACQSALGDGYGAETLNEAIREKRTALSVVSVGDSFSLGAATLRVVASPDADTVDEQNEASLILLFRYGSTNAVFTGDADEAGEHDALSRLREEERSFTCDVLLVGHHGSNTSSCEPFLTFLRPTFSVISCAKDNLYGHPDIRVLQRLESVSSTVLRTDLIGTVILHSDGETVKNLK